ncbi:MAG: hypothetical protein ACK55I_46910, partial [bacterium]
DLTEVTVFVDALTLPLIDEDLDTDIEKDSIELDRVYEGLEPGRKLLLRGLQANPTGEPSPASELVEILKTEPVVSAEHVNESPHTKLTFTAPLQHTYLRSSVEIFANVVQADHGETVFQEPLLQPLASSNEHFVEYQLRFSPLT